MYIEFIELGIGVLQMIFDKIKNRAPSEVLDSLQASILALQAHKDDEVTAANLDAQKG